MCCFYNCSRIHNKREEIALHGTILKPLMFWISRQSRRNSTRATMFLHDCSSVSVFFLYDNFQQKRKNSFIRDTTEAAVVLFWKSRQSRRNSTRSILFLHDCSSITFSTCSKISKKREEIASHGHF